MPAALLACLQRDARVHASAAHVCIITGALHARAQHLGPGRQQVVSGIQWWLGTSGKKLNCMQVRKILDDDKDKSSSAASLRTIGRSACCKSPD